jgi:hypothetical protein
MYANNTEFAIGIIFVFIGAFLLYTEYNVGYWGVVALGLVFIVKNWSVARRRPSVPRPGMAQKPKSDSIINERINH